MDIDDIGGEIEEFDFNFMMFNSEINYDASQKEKVKKFNKLRIYDKCNKIYSLISIIIKKKDWIHTYNSKACDIYLADPYAEINEFYYSFLSQMNRIPGLQELSEKNTLAFILNKFKEYYKVKFDFFPESIIYSTILTFLFLKLVRLMLPNQVPAL